jgi:hypothetical protein
MTRAETCALTHPLDMAHSPTPNAAGTRVYCICGWQGCTLRRDVGTEAWEKALKRRPSPPAPAHPADRGEATK